MAGGVAQAIERPPSKHEAWSSNPRAAKKQNKKTLKSAVLNNYTYHKQLSPPAPCPVLSPGLCLHQHQYWVPGGKANGNMTAFSSQIGHSANKTGILLWNAFWMNLSLFFVAVTE
jgi:hypothetical protein